MSGTLSIGIEELSDRYYCPNCGCQFDNDEWEEVYGYHYVRERGRTDYKCPDCGEQTVSVHI